MAQGKLTKVAELFEAARQKDESRRSAFLDSACAGDAFLRAEVESLLAHHDDSSTAATPASSAELSEGPGTNIGRYKLLQKIGEGGFGVVYMAEQSEPVHRRVALKIIKLGMDTRQTLARFEAERQALAMMDHPNIAHVLDAGATDTGRPYFVMELVKGIPLTEYCDQHSLHLRERLELFMQVCLAVQHAHQKGIIHRDLKPSNVMVTIGDGKPVPKVIDFGVAKATQQRLTERTMFTELGQFIGTPAYMSPEQAEMTGLDIDTRSDIYSLGVLLYELITGTTPFDPHKLRSAGYNELQRMIREQDPPKPSTRLSTLGDQLTTVARLRNVEPRRLGALLRGDLDWIVMKALEKDRTRRYESASGLAEDIHRHLGDEPVLAGPPSARYRLSKLIRRNRGPFIAATVIVILLIGGVTGTTIGLLSSIRANEALDAALLSAAEQKSLAEQNADRASLEAAEARLQAGIARAVNEFLNEDLLAAVAPEQQGRDVSMREVLDTAAGRIDEASAADGKFHDKPLVEAAIRKTIADTYNALGLYQEAETHAQRALALHKLHSGPEDTDTLKSMITLAIVYWREGRYDEAAPIFDDAIAKFTKVQGENHEDTLSALNLRANVFMEQGQWPEAESRFRDALSRQQAALGPAHRKTLLTQNNLALVLMRQGKLEEAERLYRETLATQRRVFGDEHPDTLITMINLGAILLTSGPYEECEQLLSRAVEIGAQVLGEEHPHVLSAAMNRAWLWGRQGHYEQAETALVQLLEVRKRVSGPSHPDTLLAMTMLGSIYTRQNKYEQAQALLAETIEAQRDTLGAEHPSTLTSMSALAAAYRNTGKYDQAESLALETLHACRKVLGPTHPSTLNILSTLAGIYQDTNRPNEALPLLEDKVEARRSVSGENDPQTLWAMNELAVLLRNQHNFEEAEPLYEQVLQARQEVLGPTHRDTLTTLSGFARLYRFKGDNGRAEKMWLNTLEQRRSALGPQHVDTRKTMGDLIALYTDTNELDKKRTVLVEYLAYEPTGAVEQNSLAWMLLTCEPTDLQDPSRALLLAELANEATSYENPYYLDTLSLAQYRTGATSQAIATEEKALELLPAVDPGRQQFEDRLEEMKADNHDDAKVR